MKKLRVGTLVNDGFLRGSRAVVAMSSGWSLSLAFLLVVALPSCGDGIVARDGGAEKPDGASDAKKDATPTADTKADTSASGGATGSGGAAAGSGGVGGGGGGATGSGGTTPSGGTSGFGGATGGRGGGGVGGTVGGRGGGGVGGTVGGRGGGGVGGTAVGGRGGMGGTPGTGGAGTGGAGTGGAGTGGAGTGGAGTGGAGTGGDGTGGAGTGGAGTGGAGTGGAGGTCTTVATFTDPTFQTFESYTNDPFLLFTSPQGYNGNFTPDGMGFAVASMAANAGTKALVVSNSAAGGCGIYSNIVNGTCLSLAGSSGIRFYAKGAGTLRFWIAGIDQKVTVGTLGAQYAVYTVNWADVGGVPTLFASAGVQASLSWFAEGTAATELYLDDITFVVP